MVRRQNPENLCSPNKETGLRAKGWNRKKIRNLERKFEKLSYHEVKEILKELEIIFAKGIKDIKEEIDNLGRK